MVGTAVDTLQCDTALIRAWQADEAFNYQRELIGRQPSLWDYVGERLSRWLDVIFGSHVAGAVARPVLIILGLALILAVLWFVYRTRPELFGRRRKTQLDYEVGEETIYGIDFDREIREAVRRQDWRQAVRYTYLQTLRTLSDGHLIDWQPHKTPTQYVYELHSDAFRQLTSHFLLVRYGRHEATAGLYDAVRQLAQTVVAQPVTTPAPETPVAAEKGGEP